MIVLGESVVAVAIAISDASWNVSSAATAVLGFASVAAVWWLYFDRQAGVVLRGSTMSVVVYSYAHIPLLVGLAAMSAGLRLVIERANDAQLGTGPSIAYIGGVMLFVLSLIGTRTVTVSGSRRLGVSLKLGGVVVMIVLLLLQSLLPPVALAGALAGLLAALVFAERSLITS